MLRPYGAEVQQGPPGPSLCDYIVRGIREQKSRREAGATKGETCSMLE